MKRFFLCMQYLVNLNSKVDKLYKWRKEIMATVQDVLDTVAAEKAEVKSQLDSLHSSISDLEAKIANGSFVTPEDLDALKVAVQNIFTPDAPVEVPVVDPVPVA